MTVSVSKRLQRLEESYQAVGNRTWEMNDFTESNLKVSQNLYTPESISNRTPKPKALEVFALLSGLPFKQDFTRPIVDIQNRISDIIGDTLHYWVAPENLGVEYCVFKWPEEPWNEDYNNTIDSALNSLSEASFNFRIGGIQINPDGCVVAKGFDEGGGIFRIREQMKSSIPFLPEKQSGWAHVPLGRILEPVGEEKFIKLKLLTEGLCNHDIASTRISSLKFIHEKRWYMEEKDTLASYPLSTSD